MFGRWILAECISCVQNRQLYTVVIQKPVLSLKKVAASRLQLPTPTLLIHGPPTGTIYESLIIGSQKLQPEHGSKLTLLA